MFFRKKKKEYENPYQPSPTIIEEEEETKLYNEMVIHYTPHATYIYVDYWAKEQDDHYIVLYKDDEECFNINGTFVICPIKDEKEKESMLRNMVDPLPTEVIIINVRTKEIIHRNKKGGK